MKLLMMLMLALGHRKFVSRHVRTLRPTHSKLRQRNRTCQFERRSLHRCIRQQLHRCCWWRLLGRGMHSVHSPTPFIQKFKKSETEIIGQAAARWSGLRWRTLYKHMHQCTVFSVHTRAIVKGKRIKKNQKQKRKITTYVGHAMACTRILLSVYHRHQQIIDVERVGAFDCAGYIHWTCAKNHVQDGRVCRAH